MNLADLGPECVDSVHRVLRHFRKSERLPEQQRYGFRWGVYILDANSGSISGESLAKLDAYFGKYKHPNAALFGLLVETHMQVGAKRGVS